MKKLDSFCLFGEHTSDYSYYKLRNILFQAVCFAC